MAAATLVRGREEGGGGSRRREEGGGKKREASGTAAAAAGEGGGGGGGAKRGEPGAVTASGSRSPVLATAARAGGRGGGRAGLGGWSLQMSLREACWRETLSRHSLPQTRQPKKDPQGSCSHGRIPGATSGPPRETQPHKGVICHEELSPHPENHS